MKTYYRRSAGYYKIPSRPFNRNGFSLPELAVIILILGILASISLGATTYEIERAKVNSIQSSLAGWLQVIQRTALENKSSAILNAGCEVTFEQLSDRPAGTTLATVSPASCATNPSLIVDSTYLGNSKVSTSSTQEQIIFTPRGTVIYPSTTSLNPVFEFRVKIDRSSRLRCVRMTGLAGVIELGSKANSSSASDTCTNYSSL